MFYVCLDAVLRAAAASSGSHFPFTGRPGMLPDKDRNLSQQTTYPYWHMRCKVLAPPSHIAITVSSPYSLSFSHTDDYVPVFTHRFGGKECPESYFEASCNTHACVCDWTIGAWSKWSQCSKMVRDFCCSCLLLCVCACNFVSISDCVTLCDRVRIVVLLVV